MSSVGVLHMKQKRLKTSASQDENERPRRCYCFEKSECIVRKLRSERLKEASSVRRKLNFGLDDDASTSSEASSATQFADELSKVWNFDFQEETPLPGHWIWAKVEEPVVKKVEESEEDTTESIKHKTIKDLFRVSKYRSQKRSLDNQFRLQHTTVRSAETSPA